MIERPGAARLVFRAAAAALAAWVAVGRIALTSDDAWISWRYAWNLVHGHGLRYSPGQPPAEGYSNLLWTLWSAVGIAVHVPVERWCVDSGVLLYAASVWLVGSLATVVGAGALGEFVALLLAATSAILASTSVSGLETPLLSFLVTLSLRLTLAQSERLRFAGALAAGLTAITHVEGPVFLVAPALLLLCNTSRRSRLGLGSALFGPAILQLLVRVVYYHSILPNTFYAKVHGGFDAGMVMLALATSVTPALTLGAAIGTFWSVVPPSARWMLSAPVLGSALFVLVANGDEIEGLRFVAPAWPALAVLAGLGAARIARAGSIGGLVAGTAAVLAAWDALDTQRVVAAHDGHLPPSPGAVGVRGDGWPLGPWGAVQPGDGWALLHHDAKAPAKLTDWYVTAFVEGLPPGGSFSFADVGVVGYALNGVDLWDLRGLNWPAATRLLNAPRGDAETTSGLVTELAADPPEVLALTCQGSHFAGRVEETIGQSGLLDRSYRFVGAGRYTQASGTQLCIFQRNDARSPTVEELTERKARIVREMPGIFAPP